MLESWQVVGARDVEAMRLLYIECMEGLGVDGPAPTQAEQIAWWYGLPHKRRAWLYYEPGDEQPIAFMMLQWKGEFATPMFGIAERARGKGYAREIIRDYIEKADGPLAGSAPINNTIINKLNDEMGWRRVGARDGVVLLYHSGTDPRQQECYDEIMRYHGID